MEKVMFLCGYFEDYFQEEIQNKTKTFVENAANTFQKRMIEGLQQEVGLHIVSAPFIGAWPNAYKDIVFRGFNKQESLKFGNINYVNFNNIWGFRNLSRSYVLKKQVDLFLKECSKEEKKTIIVYSPHTPFLEAAIYAKQRDKKVKVCLVVPDLPQYMNLSKKKHRVYDFFKSFDIKIFEKLNQQVDAYMVLTEYMTDKLKVKNRPYIVVEGIADCGKITNIEKKNRGKTA